MKTPSDGTLHTRLGDLHVSVRGAGPVAVLWHSLYVDEHSWDAMIGEVERERRS